MRAMTRAMTLFTELSTFVRRLVKLEKSIINE